jgi:uncharacterized cupin superfamily protein
MSERRHPLVVNLSEIEAKPSMATAGTKFGSRTRQLGDPPAGRAIGCSWYEVEPGKAAFPFHWHAANEEAVYVLEGEGTLRIGDARVPIRAGDYIGMPTGPDHAHQIINTGSAPLRYLCFSTMNSVEVVGYPDSKKIGAAARRPGTTTPWVRQLHLEENQKGYWDGEDTGE